MKTLRKVSDVRMCGYRVLLKSHDLKKGDTVRASGIITAEEKPQNEAVIGEIIAVGDHVDDEYPVGAKVLIIPSHVMEFVFSREEFEQEEGVKYYQCEEEDLFGII